MNKTLIALLLMFVFATTVSFAQEGEIIYVNCYPEQITVPDSRFFDFDNDSHHDLKIAWAAYKQWHIVAIPCDNWKQYSKLLNEGDTISLAPSYWYSPLPDTFSVLPMFDLLPGFTRDSIFIAVKKQIDENSYCYGWVRFSVDAGPNIYGNWPQGVCTIVDYAYCTEPNYPLVVGQTGYYWTIHDTPGSWASVHPNPTKGEFTVIGEDLQQAEVYNILGQFILSEPSWGQSIILNLSGQPAGIYLVKITDKKGNHCVKKIVKE